jgi:hypothetical protein
MRRSDLINKEATELPCKYYLIYVEVQINGLYAGDD